MEKIESPIMPITGIGPRLGAVILAEIKNIHNFRTPAQLQAFAGLELFIYQSGKIGADKLMVKHGSSYLMFVLIQAVKSLTTYSPHFKAYLKFKSDTKF